MATNEPVAAQAAEDPDPSPMAEAAAPIVQDVIDLAERVAQPLLGALAQRKAAITDTAALAGYKLAVDLAPGDTILIPLKLVKVAMTEQGVEVTFEDGKTLDFDDGDAVRMG